MTEPVSEENDLIKSSKTSPCSRYERHNKSTDNLIGIGTTFMGLDLEEGTEVLWVEVILQESVLVEIGQHFDTIVKFNHPNLLRCHTYWIEEDIQSITLYFICELMCSTLVHFIKRTKSNNKSILLKTQVRICKQILLGLSYLKSQNPPFFLPNLSCKVVFMTHDGSIKLSTIVSNKSILCLLTGKPVGEAEDKSQLSESLINFARIIYNMATLELNVDDLSQLLKHSSEVEGLHQDQISLISMILKQKIIKISDLFRSRFLFSFPTLKLMAGTVILKNKIDLSSHSFDFPSSRVFAILDGKREIMYSEVPIINIEKYLSEIKQGLHPLTNVASSDVKKISGEVSQQVSPPQTRVTKIGSDDTALTPTPHEFGSDDELFLANREIGDLIALKAWIEPNLSMSISNPPTRRLKLSLLCSDFRCRYLECDLGSENFTAEILVEDLLDRRLVPEKYKPYILEILGRVLKGENVSLIHNLKK